MKKITKVILVTISIFLVLLLLSTFSYGIDTSPYENIYKGGNDLDPVNNFGSAILSIVQVIGISVAVVMILIIGILYMVSSPDKKAQLKERMVPFVIGAALLFGASIFLTIIMNFAKQIK